MVGGHMTNSIISTLPLMAAALGRKYGIKVLIGGYIAASSEDSIYLPSLPSQSTPEMVGLARGYLDHEAAHIRETNFNLLKKSRLKPIEKHLLNTIEDYRVEKILSSQYPGCRQNFEWLILKFFNAEPDTNLAVDRLFLDWLLLTLRSLSVSQISKRIKPLAQALQRACPGLIGKVEPVLDELKTDCQDTEAALKFTRKILQIVSDFCDENASQDQDSCPNSGSENDGATDSGESNSSGENKKTSNIPDKIEQLISSSDNSDKPKKDADSLVQDEKLSAKSALKSLMNKREKELPQSLGTMLESSLAELAGSNSDSSITVAEPNFVTLSELTDSQILETKKSTGFLKNRLQNLLQALVLNRDNPGLIGRLEPNLVHRISHGSPKIFRAKSMRQGLDVAVHLLLDTSGSMNNLIELACLTVYALCGSLHGVSGVNVAATAFPAGHSKSLIQPNRGWSTVAPILKHCQNMHQKFMVKAAGNTPLAPALWYVMQEMAPLRQSRKIILLITDGEPDSFEEAQVAIKTATNIGMEMYGLGLGSQAVKDLLPGHSVVLVNLMELPQKLFGLLGRAVHSSTHF
jgi:hypothetical protein